MRMMKNYSFNTTAIKLNQISPYEKIMNAPAVAPTAQPPTADLHLARVVEQQLNASYMALLSQQQQQPTSRQHHQQPDANGLFGMAGTDPRTLNIAATTSISSLSEPSCSSANLFQPSANFLNQSTPSSPSKNPCLFNLPMMLLTMPSTSDPSATAYIMNQQQPHPIAQAPGSHQNIIMQQLASGKPSQTPPETSGPLQLPAVPKCSICGADSTGIHFGVEACAACSAFFRRTVVLNKNYACPKDGKCPFNHDSPTGQKCRSCRFKKCLEVGMDRNAVQHRRDAIGKYSAAVKRECSSPTGYSNETTKYKGIGEAIIPEYANAQSDQVLSPPTPKSPKLSITLPNVIDELTEHYNLLNQRRKIFYCNTSVAALFESDELDFHELDNFGDCMFQLYRVEPRLCVEFIDKNRFLIGLSSAEKKKILTNFVLHFQAVEEPYLTWKFGGAECNRFWVMPNRTYIDFARTEHYFDQNKAIMKELNLDKKSAIKLFQPSFAHAMETIGSRMASINLSKKEMVCLIGFVLFDPTIEGIELKTQDCLQATRNMLLKEMMIYYESLGEDAELRLANVILVMSGIKVHAQKTRENMQMLKFFDIIPRDRLFDEICGLNGNDGKNERSNITNASTPSSQTTTLSSTASIGSISAIFDAINE